MRSPSHQNLLFHTEELVCATSGMSESVQRNNNQPPFGADKAKDGILHANLKELPGSILVMESYSTGQQSDNGVAIILNQAGYVTKQGKPFTGENVREMLQNRLYIGQVRYQRYRQRRNGSRDTSTAVEWFKGQHQTLVPVDLFERCQEVRRMLRRHPHRQSKKELYLLGGLHYCEQCGHRYVHKSHRVGKDTTAVFICTRDNLANDI